MDLLNRPEHTLSGSCHILAFLYSKTQTNNPPSTKITKTPWTGKDWCVLIFHSPALPQSIPIWYLWVISPSDQAALPFSTTHNTNPSVLGRAFQSNACEATSLQHSFKQSLATTHPQTNSWDADAQALPPISVLSLPPWIYITHFLHVCLCKLFEDRLLLAVC